MIEKCQKKKKTQGGTTVGHQEECEHQSKK